MRHLAMLAGLAFKNLTRHSRRTIITALSLAIGLALFILFDSLLTGLENDGVRSMVWYDTAGLQVQQKEYWNDKDLMPLDKAIENPQPVLDYVEKAGLHATPRAIFSGEIILNQDPWPESGSLRVRFIAVDPDRDSTVFRLKETVVEGHWPTIGEEGVVMGAQMASDLGAKVGFPLTIVTRTKDGAYQTMDFPIVGILNSPNAAVNRSTIYLNLDVADTYLQLNGSVNQIAVSYSEELNAEAKAAELDAALKTVDPTLAVLPWKTTGADFLAFVQSRQGTSRILLILVFVIAAVGVSNTMLLTILERTREMGMLRAQGMQDKEIFVSLLMEAGAIGLIGGIMGLLFSLPFNLPLIGQGIDISGLIQKVGGSIPISGHLRGAWHPQTMLVSVIFGIVLSVVVSILPVRRALRMHITEALRQN